MVKSRLTRGSGFMQRTIAWISRRGREVLPGALLAFAGRLLQQALEGGGLDVDVERGPLGLVDEADELVEVDRVAEAALGAGVDVAEDAGLLPSVRSDLGVVRRSARCRSASAQRRASLQLLRAARCRARRPS